MSRQAFVIFGFVAAIAAGVACGKSDPPTSTTAKGGNTTTGGSTTATGGSTTATGGTTTPGGGSTTVTGGSTTATGGRMVMQDGGGFTRPDGGMSRDTAPRITCGGVTCGRNQPYCLNDTTCAECQANTDCTGSQPICDMTSGQCEQCVGDTDCTGGRVCRQNRCEISCTSDSDCAPPDGGRFGSNATKCNTATSQCVQCMTDADCSTNQICRTTTFTCQRQTPDGGGMTMRDGGGFTMRDGGGFTMPDGGGMNRREVGELD